jgi:hypothetical protein
MCEEREEMEGIGGWVEFFCVFDGLVLYMLFDIFLFLYSSIMNVCFFWYLDIKYDVICL